MDAWSRNVRAARTQPGEGEREGERQPPGGVKQQSPVGLFCGGPLWTGGRVRAVGRHTDPHAKQEAKHRDDDVETRLWAGAAARTTLPAKADDGLGGARGVERSRRGPSAAPPLGPTTPRNNNLSSLSPAACRASREKRTVLWAKRERRTGRCSLDGGLPLSVCAFSGHTTMWILLGRYDDVCAKGCGRASGHTDMQGMNPG